MKNYPLLSFIIVSYKNYQYIFECIDSVIMQDYPNIEIIISNDGSDDFNEIELNTYIDTNKSNNIKRVVINNNETNLGTTKNVNKALTFVTGEYIMILAADDALFDKYVFSNFAKYFEENENSLVVTSQCGMYDIDLKHLKTNAVQPNQIEMIKNYSPQELYNELSVACLIPAGGCCYRKEIYERYGYYDEHIFLIEDWSFFLRIVRMGVKVGWLDIIAMKHRDGGISHGNVNNDNKAMFHYYDDVIKITEKEILQYFDMLTIDKKKRVKKDYNNVKLSYVIKYQWDKYSFGEKLSYCIKHFNLILAKVLQKLEGRGIPAYIVSKLFKFSIIMLLIYLLCDSKELIPVRITFNTRLLIGYIGMIGFITSLIIKMILILRKIVKKLFFR